MTVKSFTSLAPDTSIGPIFVLQLLFCENRKINKKSKTTTKAREELSEDLEPLKF
jgi:hypothetical protein